MWFWYQLRYWPKVLANVGFGFGIRPKPKQWFRLYTTLYQNLSSTYSLKQYILLEIHCHSYIIALVICWPPKVSSKTALSISNNRFMKLNSKFRMGFVHFYKRGLIQHAKYLKSSLVVKKQTIHCQGLAQINRLPDIGIGQAAYCCRALDNKNIKQSSMLQKRNQTSPTEAASICRQKGEVVRSPWQQHFKCLQFRKCSLWYVIE